MRSANGDQLGARTSFLVRETGTLYVAIPHRGQQKAELRVFAVTPNEEAATLSTLRATSRAQMKC